MIFQFIVAIRQNNVKAKLILPQDNTFVFPSYKVLAYFALCNAF
jgi:hypothetical protein